MGIGPYSLTPFILDSDSTMIAASKESRITVSKYVRKKRGGRGRAIAFKLYSKCNTWKYVMGILHTSFYNRI